MAEMKAKANATATVPDEPVPEYNDLLAEEVTTNFSFPSMSSLNIKQG